VRPTVPLLAILLVSAFTLLIGFAVWHAARRRPRAVTVFIGVAVAAGLAAIGYAGWLADADQVAGGCFGVGLLLVVLGCPAWLLVGPGRTPDGTPLRPAGPRQVAKVLFGYLAACWLLAFGLLLLLGILMHLTNPSGSFR
jgi:hypothetical protein